MLAKKLCGTCCIGKTAKRNPIFLAHHRDFDNLWQMFARLSRLCRAGFFGL